MFIFPIVLFLQIQLNYSPYMKKIIFVFFIIFTVYSCTNEKKAFEPISQKEYMKSWAWKIFIFIDEGEIHPVKSIRRSFNKSISEKIYEDDFFLNNQQLAIKEEVVSVFEGVNTKK